MAEFAVPHRFSGGLPLRPFKALSTADPAGRLATPARLVVAMRQHADRAAVPCVRPGDEIRRGQTIGIADTPAGAAVHAPLAGRVRSLEARAVPTGSRLLPSECVVIDTRRDDDPEPGPPTSHWPPDRLGRLAAIRSAGIVGLGGAAFSTATKLGARDACNTLILNGAECEPYISCDDMLMRAHAETILAGAAIMLELSCASRCIVAIERDKSVALAAMTHAIERSGDERFAIAALPTVYPAGGERQLIEMLLGREVPSGGFPTDIGVVCQNVGTAYALQSFVVRGEPLISRIVTITGRGVETPQNIYAPLGTLVSDLLSHCGGLKPSAVRLVLGGNMMGYALPTADIPITKSTNCIIALTADDIRAETPEWPCIRCGECAAACPARLQPQELLRAAVGRRFESLSNLGLDDCIECGCCDIVCPSHIPLTARFRTGKLALAEYRAQQRFADAADQRYLRRKSRQERAANAAQQLQEKLKDRVSGSDAARQTTLRDAVERARRRREHDSE
jgi:electron transport complex protein RnfC